MTAPDGSQRAVVSIGGDLDLAQDAAVSPDGRRVAFIGSRAGLLDLYVMNVDGSDRQQLTSDSAQDLSSAWSPNGATLLFHRAEIAPRGRRLSVVPLTTLTLVAAQREFYAQPLLWLRAFLRR